MVSFDQQSPLCRPQVTNVNAHNYIAKLLKSLYTGVVSFIKITTSAFIFNTVTAPASTVNGQVWIDGTNYKFKSGGIVYTLLTFASAGNLVEGNTEIGIDVDYDGTVYNFEILVDDSGIEIDSTNNWIQIKDDGVTKEKINADVAGFGLAQNTDGSLEVSNGYTKLTEDTALTRADKFISVDTTSNAVQLTLPEIDSSILGQSFEIDLAVYGAGNDLTIVTSGSDTIQGSYTTMTCSNVDDYTRITANITGNYKVTISPPSAVFS